jgi:hypothetical protein
VELLLGFVLILGGGVLITGGFTGSSLASVVKGAPDQANTAGTGAAPTVTSSSPQPQSGSSPGTAVTTGVSSIAKSKGWGAAEVAAWLGVIAREDTTGSLTAQNPTSKAYGLAQFIDGPSEYATYGGSSGTVTGQLTAMANYIEQRYGTPAAALAHEQTYGWY